MFETFDAALPPSVAVTSLVSHAMLKPLGIRMRRSLVAVIPGAAASSVIVSWLIAVGGSATTKLWSAADERLGCPIAIVLSSVAAVLPPAPATTSSRLSAGVAAVKLAKLRSEMVSCSPAAKSLVTSSTSVRPPSS